MDGVCGFEQARGQSTVVVLRTEMQQRVPVSVPRHRMKRPRQDCFEYEVLSIMSCFAEDVLDHLQLLLVLSLSLQ